MLHKSNNPASFANNRQLTEQLVALRAELAGTIQQQSGKPLPERVQDLRNYCNEVITINQGEHTVETTRLCFAVRMHDAQLVQDLLQNGADIYAQGPDGTCAVEALNDEIDDQQYDKFYDLRLVSIKKNMESNAFTRATIKYHLYGFISAPFIGVGLVYIGHFPLFMVYFNQFMLLVKNYAPVFGASWSFFRFGQTTMNNCEDGNIGESALPEIKRMKQNIIYNTQKQIFSALRYGLYFASYASIALAMISTTLYGYMLTAAISTEIIRQGLKFYNLITLPFTESQLRNTPHAIGAYHNHRAKVGKTLVKLFTNVAYTAITYAWCFSPGGASALVYFMSLYIAASCAKSILCHLIDLFMQHQIEQTLEKYYAGDGQSVSQEALADLTLSRIDQLFKLLYTYSGAELAMTHSQDIKAILVHSIDRYVINNARSYALQLLDVHPELYQVVEQPRQAIAYVSAFWKSMQLDAEVATGKPFTPPLHTTVETETSDQKPFAAQADSVPPTSCAAEAESNGFSTPFHSIPGYVS